MTRVGEATSDLLDQITAADSSSIDGWEEVTNLCRTRLDTEDFEEVCKAGTIEGLVAYGRQLQRQYQDTRSYEFGRLNAFINNLHTFNTSFNVLRDVSPEASAPVWGTIQLSVELVRQANEVLQMIVDMLDEISHTLPRIYTYQKALPDHAISLRDACRTVNLLIAEFCCLVIVFYRQNPLKNILKTTWEPFQVEFRTIKNKILQVTRNIEKNAQALALHDLLAIRTVKLEPKLPCHFLSRPRNPHFTHRQFILEELDNCLNNARWPVQLKKQAVFSLYGLGGVGKTQIALEYLYSHMEDFPVIFWISAESPSKIAQDIREAIAKLGLISAISTDDDRTITQTFKNWLQSTSEKWLICFDNADEPKYLESYWPVAEHGSILITSRNPASARIRASGHPSRGRQVLPFSPEEGAILLTSLIQDVSEESSEWDIIEPQDHAHQVLAAQKLAGELGGLPLAINQMANYILDTRCSLEEFVEMFSNLQDKKELLSSSGPTFDMSYSHSLTTVWDISFSHLNDNGRHLLEILSFLDPDSIPESAFTTPTSVGDNAAYPRLAYLSNRIRYLEATRGLLAHSLISKNKNESSFVMHRLVGAITLAKLESADHQTRFNEAVELIHRVYPRLSPTESYLNLHWSKLRLYLPHVLALERQYRESESPLEPTAHFADILVSASWFMFEQNSAELALSVLPTAREVCLATKTGNEFNVASMWRTWACVYLDIGNYQAALDHFTKMLEVLKASFPPEDLTLTMGYNGVGIGNIGLGNYDAAEWNLNKSMEIRDLYPNVNPAMRGLTLANISALNCLRGDFGVALEIAQKALPLIEDNLGAESIKSSEVHLRLGNAFKGLGNLDDAFEAYFRALDIGKKVLGDGYRVASLYHNVAWILNERGDYAQAESLLLNALRIYSMAYKTKGELARSSYLMATVLLGLGRNEDAVNTKDLAATIRKEITGLDPDQDDNQESYDLLISWLIR